MNQTVEANIIRSEITSRGGGIEIDCGPMGWPGVLVSAYVNYLGGGMLGRIATSCNDLKAYANSEGLQDIGEEARHILYDRIFGDSEDEYNTFEDLEKRPVSAY